MMTWLAYGQPAGGPTAFSTASVKISAKSSSSASNIAATPTGRCSYGDVTAQSISGSAAIRYDRNVEPDRRCDTSRPRPGMSRATRSHQPARPWTVIGIVLPLVMPRGPSATSLSRYVAALEAEASTGAHTEPPICVGAVRIQFEALAIHIGLLWAGTRPGLGYPVRRLSGCRPGRHGLCVVSPPLTSFRTRHLSGQLRHAEPDPRRRDTDLSGSSSLPAASRNACLASRFVEDPEPSGMPSQT